MRRFRTGLALRLLGIAVLVPLLPGWIGWLGLLGAAWAVTFSWLITTLLSLAVVLHSLDCDGSPSLFNTRCAA
jgi:Na+-driven multidrug efflux pump